MKVSLLKARRDALMRRLRALGPVFRGSLARVALTCGKRGCRCRPVSQGGRGRRHVAFYASYRSGGRSRVFHVPASQLQAARAAQGAWVRMKAVLEALAETQESLWRAQHDEEKQRRKAGSGSEGGSGGRRGVRKGRARLAVSARRRTTRRGD